MKAHYEFDFSNEWTPTLVSMWHSDDDLLRDLKSRMEIANERGEPPSPVADNHLVYYTERVDALVEEMKRRGCAWDGEIGWHIPNNPLKAEGDE